MYLNRLLDGHYHRIPLRISIGFSKIWKALFSHRRSFRQIESHGYLIRLSLTNIPIMTENPFVLSVSNRISPEDECQTCIYQRKSVSICAFINALYLRSTFKNRVLKMEGDWRNFRRFWKIFRCCNLIAETVIHSDDRKQYLKHGWQCMVDAVHHGSTKSNWNTDGWPMKWLGAFRIYCYGSDSKWSIGFLCDRYPSAKTRS